LARCESGRDGFIFFVRAQGHEDAGIPPFLTSSKNTSSMPLPRALARALADPRIAKPHFSRTRMDAALFLAALA
jgi:hypothetical protein